MTEPAELSVADFRETAATIETEVGKVIVGQQGRGAHGAGGHALRRTRAAGRRAGAGQNDAHPHPGPGAAAWNSAASSLRPT